MFGNIKTIGCALRAWLTWSAWVLLLCAGGAYVLVKLLRYVSYDYIYEVEPFVRNGVALGACLCAWSFFWVSLCNQGKSCNRMADAVWLTLLAGLWVTLLGALGAAVNVGLFEQGFYGQMHQMGHPERYYFCEGLQWGVLAGVGLVVLMGTWRLWGVMKLGNARYQHPWGLRQTLSLLFRDVPRALWLTRGWMPTRPSVQGGWMSVCNRTDALVLEQGGRGARLDSVWTSSLACSVVYPVVGKRFAACALRDFSFDFNDTLPDVEQPEVTFVIGHRGAARLENLLWTVRSIAAQRSVKVECIVVEQTSNPLCREQLPEGVRWVHDCLDDAVAYNRSRAFNVGVKHARGRLVVLHDNDLVVPVNYASELLARFDEGFEAVNLKRYIFYMSRIGLSDLCRTGGLKADAEEGVLQNNQGGASVAVGREAYWRVGGMDEAFVGWGNEDNEFWDRLQLLRVWNAQYLPFFHIWHTAQSGKAKTALPNLGYFQEMMNTPAELRAKALSERLNSNKQNRDG